MSAQLIVLTELSNSLKDLSADVNISRSLYYSLMMRELAVNVCKLKGMFFCFVFFVYKFRIRDSQFQLPRESRQRLGP